MTSIKQVALLRNAEAAIARRDFKAAHALCIGVLEEDSDSADAFLVLGRIAAEHNNHEKAVTIYDRALKSAPNDARIRACKAQSLFAGGRTEAALDEARAAAQCPNLTGYVLDTLGVVFSLSGMHTLAVTFFRRATQASPDRAGLWFNLGAAEQFLGRFEAAVAAFRRATKLDPTDTRAWWARSELGDVSATGSDMDQLKQLFNASQSPDDRLRLGHAISRSYELATDDQLAMDWLNRAKRAKCQASNYHWEQDRLRFAAAESVARARDFSATLPESALAPIFVVGLPRTGTTLVERILSTHTAVQSVGESPGFAAAVSAMFGAPLSDGFDPFYIREAFDRDIGSIEPAYKATVRRHVDISKRFVDKMPFNFFYAPLILEAFPNARIVCLTRLAADAMLSNFKTLFSPASPNHAYSYRLEDTARYVAEYWNLIAVYESTLPKHRFMTLPYETLVKEPRASSKRLLQFCGLDWDPTVLRFDKNPNPSTTASSIQVRKPIHDRSVGRWRTVSDSLEPALSILKDAALVD